ncbi:hypothetical protein EGW08_023481 [Elysia chlorotica]|uniref:Uncharacterized protein n=1 Tax=Elysia chlorotica TaxID=188477 RepID=A0A3S1AVY6_ELYCH|nr:hypothetical protein EGW08_023481 [Elysia chlorotica]
MKKLFELFHPKRTKSSKENNLAKCNSFVDEDNFKFTEAGGLKTFNKKITNAESETKRRPGKGREVIQATSSPLNHAGLVVSPFLTPPKRTLNSGRSETRHSHTKYWSRVSRELRFLDGLLTHTPRSGVTNDSVAMGTPKPGGSENRDEVFLDGSYFEDDYWLSYSDLGDDDIGWESEPLFSTPFKAGPLYQPTRRVYMGVASLRASRKNRSLPLKTTNGPAGAFNRNTTSRRAVKRKHSSLPGDLDKIYLEFPPLVNLEPTDVEAMLISEGKCLSDEEIKDLSPFHPSVALNLAFDNVEESTCMDVDGSSDVFDNVLETAMTGLSLDTTVPEPTRTQVSNTPPVVGNTEGQAPLYKSKKPTDLTISAHRDHSLIVPGSSSKDTIRHLRFDSPPKVSQANTSAPISMESHASHELSNENNTQRCVQKIEAGSGSHATLESTANVDCAEMRVIVAHGASVSSRHASVRRRSTESGYGSCSKTPALATQSPPGMGQVFFTPQSRDLTWPFISTENCSDQTSELWARVTPFGTKLSRWNMEPIPTGLSRCKVNVEDCQNMEEDSDLGATNIAEINQAEDPQLGATNISRSHIQEDSTSLSTVDIEGYTSEDSDVGAINIAQVNMEEDSELEATNISIADIKEDSTSLSTADIEDDAGLSQDKMEDSIGPSGGNNEDSTGVSSLNTEESKSHPTGDIKETPGVSTDNIKISAMNSLEQKPTPETSSRCQPISDVLNKLSETSSRCRPISDFLSKVSESCNLTNYQRKRQKTEHRRNRERPPVKRLLGFFPKVPGPTKTLAGQKNVEVNLTLGENHREMPYLYDLGDENNNFVYLNTELAPSLDAMGKECLSPSTTIPIPILTSSPMQKTKVNEKCVDEPEQNRKTSHGFGPDTTLNSDRGQLSSTNISAGSNSEKANHLKRTAHTSGRDGCSTITSPDINLDEITPVKYATPIGVNEHVSSTETSLETKPLEITHAKRARIKNAKKIKRRSSATATNLCVTTEKPQGRGMDINNNPLVVDQRKTRRSPVAQVLSSSEEESGDECQTKKKSPTSTDYILIRRVAQKIIRRVPEECGQQKNMDTARVMEFLHQYYNHELALVNGSIAEVNTTESRKGENEKPHKKSPNGASLPHLKYIYREMLEKLDPKRLTASNSVGILLAGLLADRADVVDECCNFAFQNIRLLGQHSELFFACPPELVLMLLSNRQVRVEGPHGFPVSYEHGEREVLVAAHGYCRRNRTGIRHVDRNLRDMLVSAADQGVWEKQRRFYMEKKRPRCQSKDDETHDQVATRSHFRQRYNIVFHHSKIFAKVDEESLVPQLAPDVVLSTFKAEGPCGVDVRNENSHNPPQCGRGREETRDGLTGASVQLSGLTRVPSLTTEEMLETCTSEHALHHVWFSFRRRKGIPYMTGLQLVYAYKGNIKRIVLGDFKSRDRSSSSNRRQSEAGEPMSTETSSSRSRSDEALSRDSSQDSSTDQGLSAKQTVSGDSQNQPCDAARGDEQEEKTGGYDGCLDDPEPLKTVFKLEIGEHIVCVRVQSTCALHNLEFTTNRGRCVKAHQFCTDMHPWRSVQFPPLVERHLAAGQTDQLAWGLQAITAETMTSDSLPSDVILANVRFVWAYVVGEGTDGSAETHHRDDV